jgi:putative FmdB family regulatory protein
MPTYEYACSSCGNEWETEQSIKEEPLTECPRCHEATARRQISRGTGFILKGSGWYSDLYSSSSNKKPEGGGDKGGGDKGGGDKGGGDKGGGDKGSSGSGSSEGSSGGSSSGGTAPSTPSTSSTSAAA